MKLQRRSLKLTVALGLTALASTLFAPSTPSQAAPEEGLTISPVGYNVVNGTLDTSNPIRRSGLTEDVGYSSTASYNGAQTSKSVIGADGRAQVTNTTNSPYRRTGQLSSGCTAWMISANTAATAAHCIRNNMRFTPARNGNSAPYGSFAVTQVWVDERGEDAPGGDWALLKFSSPIGNRVGWYGLAPKAPSAFSGNSATVIGYPGDKPYGTMWQHTDSVTEANSRMFFYLTDTYGGQSGSAVTTTNANVANGIHVWGRTGARGNGATRITGELFNVMARLR